jgi:hypothetical protein
MGIKAGTTITVTFDARQIAELDVLLQLIEMDNYQQRDEYEKRNCERINNVFRALHQAGYR